MLAELITARDPAWTRFLERAEHDFYHLPAYVELASRYEGGTPAAFYAEHGSTSLLIPLLIRSLPRYLNMPDEWVDAITPYGYPSPLLHPVDHDALNILLPALREVAAARCLLTIFMRFHPLLGNGFSSFERFGQLNKHGETVAIDLVPDECAIWSQMRLNHRRNIRGLLKEGFRVQMDDWSRLDDFCHIYAQTMERVCAQPFYFFPGDYFADLRAVLGPDIHLGTVTSPEGELAAAGLFTTTCGIVEYHLGGTADNYLYCAPAKLLVDQVWRWAKARGCRVLHLGGGVNCHEDSLFHFKTGFSSLRFPFYTYRMVLDDEKYQIANESWHHQLAGQPEASDFFPMYRRPIGEMEPTR